MSLNISVMALGVIFVFMLIIKIIQNYKTKKQSRKKTELLTTEDIINVLFNVGLFTAGVASILLTICF